MKTTLILAAIFCLFGINIYSQDRNCTERRANLPAVRGIKLDMPKTAVMKIYPSMQVTNKNGLEYGTIGKKAIKENELQNGIETVTVVFDKNSVASVLINYDENVNWVSSTEFTEYVGESLQLPVLAWKNAAGTDRKMVCADFVISGGLNKNNRAVLLLIKPESEFKLPSAKN
ncbi:MAG TPA: hypothetical protein PKY59_05555 [Pyrinomonadaceae bacterium]|nr:hypothetical protein [Pyrinomonadaceae bacterium]